VNGVDKFTCGRAFFLVGVVEKQGTYGTL